MARVEVESNKVRNNKKGWGGDWTQHKEI